MTENYNHQPGLNKISDRKYSAFSLKAIRVNS
jgi:hypothetical protein